jgi:hypothetical protein
MGMNQELHFTRHGSMRARQRLSIDYKEVSMLVGQGRTLEILSIPGTNKVHYIFYDPEKDDVMALILDAHTKSVITVLPREYYENLNSPLTEEQVQAAKRLYYEEKKTPRSFDGKFQVKIRYMDPDGKQKTIKVFERRAPQAKGSASRFLQLPEVVENLNSDKLKTIRAMKLMALIVVYVEKGEVLDQHEIVYS